MIKRSVHPAVAPRYKRGNNKLVPLTRCHLLSALKCQVMSLWWNIFPLDVCLTKQVQCLALFYFNKRKQLLIWDCVKQIFTSRDYKRPLIISEYPDLLTVPTAAYKDKGYAKFFIILFHFRSNYVRVFHHLQGCICYNRKCRTLIRLFLSSRHQC